MNTGRSKTSYVSLGSPPVDKKPAQAPQALFTPTIGSPTPAAPVKPKTTLEQIAHNVQNHSATTPLGYRNLQMPLLKRAVSESLCYADIERAFTENPKNAFQTTSFRMMVDQLIADNGDDHHVKVFAAGREYAKTARDTARLMSTAGKTPTHSGAGQQPSPASSWDPFKPV